MKKRDATTTHIEVDHSETDMQPTRRRICLLAVATPLAGCVSDPGLGCRGATVRLSLRPATFGDAAIRLAVDSLPAEAVGVIETGLESEHVEHCVSWDPEPDETGPSAGLAELARVIESRTDADPTGGLDLDVTFRGGGYRLSLVTEAE